MEITGLCKDLKERPMEEIAFYANYGYKMLHLGARNQIAVDKGKVGETIWMDVFAHYSPKDVSKTKHSGDFVIERNNCKLMVEIKNYSAKIPTKEVSKFYRDLENYDCGLFISNQPITGKKTFHVESNCVFVHISTDANVAVAAAEYLLSKFAVSTCSVERWRKMQKYCGKIVNDLSALEAIKYEIVQLRDAHTKSMNNIYSSVLELQIMVSVNVKKMLSVGGHEDVITDKNVEIPINGLKIEDNICVIAIINMLNKYAESRQIKRAKINKVKSKVSIEIDGNWFEINIMKTKKIFTFAADLSNIGDLVKKLSENTSWSIKNGLISITIMEKNISDLEYICKYL